MIILALSRIAKFFSKEQVQDLTEAYLNGSVDIADLNYRMKTLIYKGLL